MQVGIPQNDRERDAFSQMLAQGFAVDQPAALGWLESSANEDVRLARQQDQVVAGCLLLPMGQFFGGRSVPTVGIAGVAVRADRLRQGIATGLMRAVLGELRADGWALATLYASIEPLYRGVGFEHAGSHYTGSCKPAQLPRIPDRALPSSIVTEADWPVIDEVYARWARTHAGHMDRPPHLWHRIRRSSAFRGACYGLMVGPRDAPQGYLFYRQARHDDGMHTVQVQDMVALTDAARRTLMGLLRDLSTMAREVTMPTAPADPFYGEPPHPAMSLRFNYAFHVRVLDVVRACTQRGYPKGLRTAVELELDDEDLPDQAGRWRLELQGGRAVVRRGGEGRIRLGPRGLATIFTGHRSAHQAAQLGLCSGTEEDLDAMSAIFAGPAPWMREVF